MSLLMAYSASAQDNSARIVVLVGGNIPFNFTSLRHYEDGIERIGGTTLGVSVSDLPSANTLSGWRIEYNSFGAQANLIGDNGGTLPLSAVQIRATNGIGLTPGAGTVYNQATVTDYQDLTAGPTVMFRTTDHLNTDISTHQLNIDYRCGVATSLLGEEADTYTVEIEYTLIPEF